MDARDLGCERCGSVTCQSRSGSQASAFGVAVVGAEGVGKSAICVQLKTRRFIWEYDSTDEYTYQVKVPLGDHCSALTVVDTLRETNFEEFDWTNINGLLLVFSVADAQSLRSVHEIKAEIAELAARRRPQQLRFLLVGNKTDLAHDRQVSAAQGKEAAAELGCEYVEVSARYDAKLIREAFQVLLQKMRAARKRRTRHYWTSVVDQVVSSGSSSTTAASKPAAPGLASSTLQHSTSVGPSLLVPLTFASSSSCDSLLSPTSPQAPSPMPSDSPLPGVQFDFAQHTSLGAAELGIAPKRSSLKKSVMKRVSSFRGTGHPGPAGRQVQRRHSKASLESNF